MNVLLLVVTLFGMGLVCAGPVVSFAPEAPDEERVVSEAVVLEGGRLATIAVVGALPDKTTLGADGSGEALEVLVHDPVSRLTILKLPASLAGEVGPKRGRGVALLPGEAVYLDAGADRKASRVVKWESSYRGSLLPVSLLRVHHPGADPPKTGAPIFNAAGELVAICHEPATKFGNGTFALPVEVVSTIERKFEASKTVAGCWIGISVNATDAVMAVTMVRPDSPGAKGGVRKGDILLKVGGREVKDYADAVNAFFYLVAGEATEFVVLRGMEVLKLKVTPEVHPAFSAPRG